MKKRIYLIAMTTLFIQQSLWAVDTPALLKCMQNLRGVLPAEQYHDLPSHQTALYFFNDGNYGGRLNNGPRSTPEQIRLQGVLMIDPTGVRVCTHEWRRGERDTVGFKFPLHDAGNTRFKYVRNAPAPQSGPQLTELGSWGNIMLDTQSERGCESSEPTDYFLQKLIAYGLDDSKNNVTANERSRCMSSVNLDQNTYDRFIAERRRLDSTRPATPAPRPLQPAPATETAP